MKTLATIFTKVAILCSCGCFSQNLVSNPSFEIYDTCPNVQGQISYANGWFQPCKTWSSSDYYNQCDTTQSMGVPQNLAGYQSAKDGGAYAGIVVYSNMNYYREFIEVNIDSPLLQNKKYCISFYISLAELSGNAINTFGCLFTIDSFLTNSAWQEIFLIPQVENTDSIITDTMNWVLISGEFTASGGEQFLTIGNFRNDSNTSVVVNPGGVSSSSIYYIDDVSVTLCDTTAVGEFQNSDFKFQIFPNPASGSVTVTAMGGDKIIVSDITGRKIKSIQNFKNSASFFVEEIENGIYFISLYSASRLLETKKIIIIH